MKKLVLLLTAFAIAGSVSLTGCAPAATDTEEVTPEVENTTPAGEDAAETKEEVKTEEDAAETKEEVKIEEEPGAVEEEPGAVEETETPAEGN
ncbi:hypothetical protein [Oscillatoria salina]|uniref:hypothetical protein n=1 Tax=Oscillatoria salina TaxID=331517 RepID=UPI0013B5B5E9|nr:hypothetical protein [Oscillatoria salina]MBZ8182385.1 hypothetical protein [Oscillatoria salina IIICB1]NET90146.1 hypothetical protein [Kamptonema sp. SIO1D9]